MARQNDTAQLGQGRRAGSSPATIRFEWMSFSGRMRLTGAEEVLWPGASFFSALLGDAERKRVRAALEAAAVADTPILMPCRLDTRSGPRTFLLKGEVVRGEVPLSPHVAGVLIEDGPAEPDLEVLARLLAGALGDEALGGDAEGGLPGAALDEGGRQGASA